MEKRSQVLYERFLAAAKLHLECNKLEDAERAFTCAIRQVHVQKNKVYELAIALRGLGFVYKARGSIQKNAEDLIKASGLFIASITRLQECILQSETKKSDKVNSEIIRLQEEIKNVHTIFICEILQSSQYDGSIDFHRYHYYKESLRKIREYCQLKINSLDDMPVFDPAARDISAEKGRIRHTQCLYGDLSKSMRELITCMIEDCMKFMSSPPCKYSVLGLGSTAKEEATPYSDLEFCILIEKSTDNVLQYFTNLTNFLHLKVVELGETILPSLGIKSLNNYYSGNKEDDWFYDDAQRGFSFDGAMPWASKTPKGRDKTSNKPWVQSLIKTPDEMADLLSETSIFKEGYHMADVLSTFSVIYGDCSLVNDYTDCMREYIREAENDCNPAVSNVASNYHVNPMPWKQRILQELIDVKDKYHNSLGNYVKRPGISYAVKADIYRFPSLVVQYVGKYFDCQCSSSWQTIDKLECAKIISSEGAHNLRAALGIAAELRLRTYLSNQCQSEHLNALLSLKEDFPDNLSFLLLRFFFTVCPLEKAIEKVISEDLLHVIKSDFYDDNPNITARMYLQLRKYHKAEKILKDMFAYALHSSSKNEEDPEIAEICKLLGNALFLQQKLPEAVNYYKIDLEINQRVYMRIPQQSILKRIGDSYTNYGVALRHLGQIEEALSCYGKALEIRISLFEGSSTAVNQMFYLEDIADAHFNLSVVYIAEFKDVHKFFYHNEQAIDIAKSLLENCNLTYYHHPSLLLNQGLNLYNLRRFEESAKAYQEALELVYCHKKYDIFTLREATLLNNLGNAVIELGDLRKARVLHNRAYEIRTHIHGTNDDDSLARSLNNFGLINEHEGKYKEAYEFYVQARDMSIRIHGEHSADQMCQLYARNAKRMAEKCRTNEEKGKCVIF